MAPFQRPESTYINDILNVFINIQVKRLNLVFMKKYGSLL